MLVIVFYLGFKIDVLSQYFKTEEFLFGACVEVKVKHGFRDRLLEKILTGTYPSQFMGLKKYKTLNLLWQNIDFVRSNEFY
jgi:hypothetical protein